MTEALCASSFASAVYTHILSIWDVGRRNGRGQSDVSITISKANFNGPTPCQRTLKKTDFQKCRYPSLLSSVGHVCCLLAVNAARLDLPSIGCARRLDLPSIGCARRLELPSIGCARIE